MQWQLILETTMHAFDINTLLTMIAINKLTDRTETDLKMTENAHTKISQCKNNQCGSKNTHVAVPEKLTIIFFLALCLSFFSLTIHDRKKIRNNF